MKAGKPVLVVLLVALFAAAAAQAQSQPAQLAGQTSAVKPAAAKGIIKSITDTEVVIETKVGGEKVETTYVLTPETIRKGDLQVGARVVVRYHVVNNIRTATKVRVQKPKAKAEKKT